MCKTPVTFGGGIIMVNGLPLPSGLKWPLSSHFLYILASVSCGSYGFSNFSFMLQIIAEIWLFQNEITSRFYFGEKRQFLVGGDIEVTGDGDHGGIVGGELHVGQEQINGREFGGDLIG